MEPLRNLTNLTRIDVDCNQIYSIEPLKDLMKLNRLDVSGNNLWNVDELQILMNKKLVNLRLYGCALARKLTN